MKGGHYAEILTYYPDSYMFEGQETRLMMKKISSFNTRAVAIFALFVLLLAAFPARPQAASSTVSLRNEPLKNDNAWHSYNQSGAEISGWTSGRYKLSSDSSVLYLDGFYFSSSVSGINGIVAEGPLKIIVTGTNSISCKGYGLYVGGTGALTLQSGDISGAGKLTFSGDSGEVFLEGALNISSGTLQATNLSASSYNVADGAIRVSNYIVANEASETSVISGGLVTATEGTTFNGPLEIESGSLTAGRVYCAGGLTQKGGLLNTTKEYVQIAYGNYNGSGGSLTSKKAIHVMNGDMLISGANVRAANGIVDIKRDLNISGGYLTVDKYGIKVDGDLRISGSGIITTSLYDPEDSVTYTSNQALSVRGKLVSDGGEIRATTNSNGKYALRVSGETIINKGSVTAKMTDHSSEGFVTAFSGPVYLQGGKLTAAGNTVNSVMICSGDLQINNNAVLELTGGKGFALQVNGNFVLNNGIADLSTTRNAALSASKVKMTGGKLMLDGGYGSAWHVSDSVDLADDIWMSEPSDGMIHGASEYNYIYTNENYFVSRAVLQKVDSISVRTVPTAEIYWREHLDPTGLVLDVKYADGSTAQLSYDTHPEMFSFRPSLNALLSPGTRNIEVTCLTKKTTFNVEVKNMGAPALSGTVSTDSHRLRWSDAEGADWFELYGRKQGESEFSVLISSNVSGYTNGGLSPGETWEYYVVAIRDSVILMEALKGPESNHVILTATLEPPKISLSGSTYDSAVIKWDEIEGAEGYEVYRSGNGDNFEKISSLTDTEFNDPGLITGREYTYYVKAVIPDKSVYSEASNKVKVTPDFSGKTSLEVKSNGGYELIWKAVDGATGYEIRRGNGTDLSRTMIAKASGDATSYTDRSADIYSVYNYTVTPIRTTAAGSFRGMESNSAVTVASKKPEPVPPNKEEPSGTKFNLLQARSGKVTMSSIQIKWKKVAGAKKYIVYGNKCGARNRYRKLTSTTGSKLTFKKVAGKKVTRGTYFKFLVYALNSKGKVISISKTVHVTTKGGKHGNDKSVKTAAKKNKVTLRKGKSFKLKAKAVPASKKLKVSRHRKIKYETSNNKVAKVSSKGVIKATGKGTCYVYAYTQNGVFAKVKVKVN